MRRTERIAASNAVRKMQRFHKPEIGNTPTHGAYVGTGTMRIGEMSLDKAKGKRIDRKVAW